MTSTSKEVRALVDRVLGYARLADVRVRVQASSKGWSRFADNMPTTAGDVDRVVVSVTAVTGDGRRATAEGTRLDDASLAALVRNAETMAEFSPVDPEAMPALGAVAPASVSTGDGRVSRLDGVARGKQVEQAISSAVQVGVKSAGYLEHEDIVDTYADRAGLFTYEHRTELQMSCTCRTSDGSGASKSGFRSHQLAGLDGAALAQRSAQWALRSSAAEELAPGPYTVILSSDAVAELLDFFVDALSHRLAVEERSPFSAGGGATRIGEVLFHPKIDIWSDPDDSAHPARKFAAEGVPLSRVDWVKEGQLLALWADRFWAAKAGVELRPLPSSIHMKGDSKSLDELVAGVPRGVLVTRFWYNRSLDPQTILATGLTRDGTFLVEDGKIAKPIKNFRYNDSPLTLLERVVALGRPQRAGLVSGKVWVVPPMVVEGFRFSSVSDAV